MKKIFPYFLIILICNQVFSQNSMDNWCLGRYCGLNFSTGTPSFFPTSIFAYEASASISDSTGNLLFYTEGTKIYDRNNLIMPNGNNLKIGLITDFGSSITQGAIIIPIPNSVKQYYVIYLSDTTDFQHHLEYAVIDMSLNDGYGDVIDKNIKLSSGAHMWEKLTAVKHGNGTDWWLVGLSGTFNLNDSIFFEKFLITETGFVGPIYQFYDLYNPEDAPGVQGGQMKFTNSGTKLGNTRGTDVDIFDFDRCTGEFTNFMNIDTVGNVCYGLEFSDDATKIYVSTQANYGKQPKLFQICLTCDIDEKTILFRLPKENFVMGQLQIATNKKIYFTAQQGNDTTVFNKRIYYINDPNIYGIDCKFDSILNLIEDTAALYIGFPNMPNYNLGPLTGIDSCATLDVEVISEKGELKIYPNPTSRFIILSDKNNNSISCETVLFYNSTGVLVKKIKQPTGTLDVSDLAQGIYVVAVTLITGERDIMKLEILKKVSK